MVVRARSRREVYVTVSMVVRGTLTVTLTDDHQHQEAHSAVSAHHIPSQSGISELFSF